MYTDTHAHLYLEAFGEDRDQMIRRALERGVTRMFLPNIDTGTMENMFELVKNYPDHCYPMMGLHPTSVDGNYREQLEVVGSALTRKGIIAIGETGIDLYWDKTFYTQQVDSFRKQIGWAREHGLPLVIHARDSFNEIFRILDQEAGNGLRGVFHSFTGNLDDLEKALSYGFMIGINGIVTFRNSGLDRVVKHIPLDRLLLETDAPFLAPVPYRGKRNESSYLVETASKVAEIHGLTPEEIGRITSENSDDLFLKTREDGS